MIIQVSHSLNFFVVKKLKEVIASLVLRTVVKPLPCWRSGVAHCILLNFSNYWILNYFRKLKQFTVLSRKSVRNSMV